MKKMTGLFLCQKTYDVIENIALNDFKLDVYPNQIEIIDSEQMLEAYTSVGMPNYYKHWSYGKAFEIKTIYFWILQIGHMK